MILWSCIGEIDLTRQNDARLYVFVQVDDWAPTWYGVVGVEGDRGGVFWVFVCC